MKKLMYGIPLSFMLMFGAACSNDSEQNAENETDNEETEVQSDSESSETESTENETSEETDSTEEADSTEETETAGEEAASESEEESSETEEEGTEESTETEESASAFSTVSDNQRDIIEQRFEDRTNDDFIISIESQNDEYSDLVVHVDENIGNINERGLQSKLEGIGTSIREMTSGILYDNAEGTLPALEFRNADEDVIGVFDSHDRNERMEFRP
ncbi:hypothetical protein [Corticicoccus populi]|uniref:Uncharacterized protein n=1 Tax=Corticicoccus populi TaxID=1812821 RepID=A0ABW5WUC9_9STAP